MMNIMTGIRIPFHVLLVGIAVCVVRSEELLDNGESLCRRSPHKLLQRFSDDEQSQHNRERRDAIEDLTSLVIEIEDLTKLKNPTPVDHLLSKDYCYKSLFNQDLYDLLIPCIASKYRDITGDCNNAVNRLWGRSNYPFQRLLPSIYSDGIETPAEYRNTSREISRAFVGNEVIYDEHSASELVMHMGQFIDHDVNLSPHLKANCTTCNQTKSCLPIPCKEDDPICGDTGCIPFTRSRPVLDISDTCPSDIEKPIMIRSRNQLNGITSFLDGSNVYGSFPETTKELRKYEGGNLTTDPGADPNNEEHIHLLPPDKDSDCEDCAKGGDIRAAEQPVLTSLHTLFVHVHNGVAHKLSELNPQWDNNDDILFEEARRIVGAVMQKIVYGEWLPLVLGRTAMDRYHLGLWEPYQGYDESLDPTVYTDFATAFFRFGHSFIPEVLKRVKPSYEDLHEDIELKYTFFNASVTRDLGNGGINSLLLGTLEKRLLAVDRHHSKSVHYHLFEDFNDTKGFGLDLVALNIQRGRDHGLPPYLKYRELCGLSVPSEFQEMKDFMDTKGVEAFKKIYKSVKEIEPYVGMLAENHLDGALVGPTLGCIIGKQFHNLKHGDRFWFENTAGSHAFSADQLQAIRKVTLARLLCDNVHVDEIQPAVFRLKSDDEASTETFFYDMINTDAYPDEKGTLLPFVNRRVLCNATDQIPAFSLEAWTDELLYTL